MLFEDVFINLRSGTRLHREAWEDSGDYIFMFPGTEDQVVPRDSLHSVMLGRVSTNMMSRIDKRVGDSVMVGWTPSSEDLFADDWSEKD